VYHEVGHSWNANIDPSVQRCRYFDEAFASYFESMSLGHFKGDSALSADMESSRRWFIRSTEKDSLGRITPIAKYGDHEIGGYSYTKGAWSLYVLHRLIGEDAFNKLIRAMLNEFTDKPIDFQNFKKLAETVSKRKLGKFFDEWIFGTVSTKLMLDNTPIDSVVQRYR
jgi:aminopeptidase N